MKTTKTVAEMKSTLEKNNPGKLFTVSDCQTAIGVWDKDRNRFETCSSMLISGGWAMVNREMMANGKPIWTYNAVIV